MKLSRKKSPETKVIAPPAPDDIALRFASALLASGQYEDAAAAIARAWWLVPEFYIGRRVYVNQIAPLYFTTAMHPPTLDDTPEDMPKNAISG